MDHIHNIIDLKEYFWINHAIDKALYKIEELKLSEDELR